VRLLAQVATDSAADSLYDRVFGENFELAQLAGGVWVDPLVFVLQLQLFYALR
jgi:hypothetical protein